MTTYIKTLFEEKGIDTEDSLGLEGHIGLNAKILFEFITALNLSERQMQSIEDTYRKIDSKNGDIKDYTKYLAKGMIEAYSLTLIKNMDTIHSECRYCLLTDDCIIDSNGKLSCNKCYDNDLGVAKYAILASPTLSEDEVERVQLADTFDEVFEVVKTKGNGTQAMFLSRLETGFKYKKGTNALLDLKANLKK